MVVDYLMLKLIFIGINSAEWKVFRSGSTLCQDVEECRLPVGRVHKLRTLIYVYSIYSTLRNAI